MMCGRYVSASKVEDIAEFFSAIPAPVELGANYNVAPTNDVYAVIDHPEGRAVQVFQWGLVPAWAKDTKIGSKMINARAETVAEKPAFRSAIKRRRCLVPLDAFYEWQTLPADAALGRPKPVKQPHAITRLDGRPIVVAGLWETWRDKAAPADDPAANLPLNTLTLITVAANSTMQAIHDRMPAILEPATWAQWLDTSNVDVASLCGLLVPAPPDVLTLRPVSTLVNNVRNKGIDNLASPQ
jgi:putative SOS response-associated peptidase YedK